MRRTHSPVAIAIATILACAAFAATAFAFAPTTGTTQTGMANVGEDVATTKNTVGWSALAAATRTITVPPGGAVVNARFTAQSNCGHKGGTAVSGSCSVRITANGVQLQPATGAFAFDSIGSTPGSAGDDESHAIERSIQLTTAGTYVVQVDLNVTASTKFVVRYWHLAVETSAP